jgi:hypothetical protein
MDSFFSNGTLQFIGIQFFVGTTMICVKKLYTIMCHIEEDKNRKFYMQYYKIGQLESELDMVKNKVSELTELCAQLQDQNASSSASTETCSIESISLQMPEKPSFDDCIEVLVKDLQVDITDSPKVKEELVEETETEEEEVFVQSGEQEEPKKEAPKYKYGLGFLIG